MKILIIIFIYILFIIKPLFSQDYINNNITSNLRFENQYLLPYEFKDDFSLIIKKINEFIYIYDKGNDSKKANQNLSIYKLGPNKMQKISITMPMKEWISDFYILNDVLYLLSQHYIFKYKLIEDSAYYTNNILLDKSFYEINIWGNKIILLKSCWSCDDPGIFTYIYDTTGILLQTHEFKIPEGFQLEIMEPNKRFSYFNGKYLLSDILNYNITIFNDKFDTIGILHRNIDIFEKEKNNPEILDKRKFGEWRKDHNTENFNYMNRMDLIEFLNDSTIFICFRNDSKNDIHEKYHHDIWKFNKYKNEWELYKKDLIDNNILNKNDLVSINNFRVGLFEHYKISNDFIFVFDHTPYIINDIVNKKLTYKEMWENNKNYYLNNDLNLSLYIFSLK